MIMLEGKDANYLISLQLFWNFKYQNTEFVTPYKNSFDSTSLIETDTFLTRSFIMIHMPILFTDKPTRMLPWPPFVQSY